MRTLRATLRRLRPELEDADARIRAGDVTVDGSIVTNPASMVRPGSAVAVTEPRPLRGRLKLQPALDRWDLPVAGAVALDAGAAAGGFVQALLEAGAARVYAVEAGYGQLLGSLRQDTRVVNLERTNVGELDRELVPDPVGLFTLDLGYLALADGASQLERVEIAPRAELVGLVKPMFELRLDRPPEDRATLDRALAAASAGIERAGWVVLDSMDSPHPGSRGARELFVRARRR